MSINDEIHVGDIGTIFTITITEGGSAIDISSATTKEFHFDRPNANGKFSKDAIFVTNGMNGELKYTTVADDLDTPGEWLIQTYLVMPSGEWHTNIDTFKVFENINGE